MNDSLPQLPEYDPHPDLWSRIETDLVRPAESSVEPFNRLREVLPAHEPKADLWLAIESELNTSTVRPLWNKPQMQWLWAGVAAAAMLVFVGTWSLLSPKSTEQIRVEYAIEQPDRPTHTQPVEPAGQSSADKRAEEFIARQCANYQFACQRPEVHELRNQLAELATEQKRIADERRVFGDDPVFVRAQVKVENQRAEVIKELITLLRS